MKCRFYFEGPYQRGILVDTMDDFLDLKSQGLFLDGDMKPLLFSNLDRAKVKKFWIPPHRLLHVEFI